MILVLALSQIKSSESRLQFAVVIRSSRPFSCFYILLRSPLLSRQCRALWLRFEQRERKRERMSNVLFDNKNPDVMRLKGQFLSIDIAYKSAEVETLEYRNI